MCGPSGSCDPALRPKPKKKTHRTLMGKTSICPRCLSDRTMRCTPYDRKINRCKNCGYAATLPRWKEEYRAMKDGFKTKYLQGDFNE